MGPNADDCNECLHVKDGKYCVADCSHTKYPKDGICLNCHEACNGCRGPRNIISDDGCIQCDHAIIHPNTTIQKCLKKNATCPGSEKRQTFRIDIIKTIIFFSFP